MTIIVYFYSNHWLVEAAEPLHVFSAYFLHELHLNQVQLDELYAISVW